MNSLNDNDHKNLADIGNMYNSNYINKVLLETAEGDHLKLDKMENDHQKTLKKFAKVYKTGGVDWKQIFGTVIQPGIGIAATTIAQAYRLALQLVIPIIDGFLKKRGDIDPVAIILLEEGLKLPADIIPILMKAVIYNPKTNSVTISNKEALTAAIKLLNEKARDLRNDILIQSGYPPLAPEMPLRWQPPQALLENQTQQQLAQQQLAQQQLAQQQLAQQQLVQQQLAQQQQVQQLFSPNDPRSKLSLEEQQVLWNFRMARQQQGGEISECSFSMDLTDLSETPYQKGGGPMNFSKEIDLTASEFNLADVLGGHHTQQKRSNNDVDTPDKSGAENYTLSEFSLADILGSKNTKQQRSSNNTIDLSHLLRGGDDDNGDPKSLEEILKKIDYEIKK